MSFLICDPTVFVIENRYEILVNTAENGQCAIRVGDETFYNEKAGILISETTVHKIAIPKKLLEQTGCYSVIYRKTIVKKSYFSKFAETEMVTYPFKALIKTEDIHLYHVADVHFRFEEGIRAATYFGEDLDVLVVNGDIAEVNKESDFTDIAKFMGAIAKGSVPVIFVRGNHDTRGRLASEYSKYFPTENENTYFTFDLGIIAGVALDCGEDKYDDHPEYGGANRFEAFRRQETEFLKNIRIFDDKIVFAISHVCPVRAILDGNPLFDIERDVYTEWNHELERLGIKFMLTGHTHKAELVPPNGGLLAHNYPLVVGSECQKNGRYLGAALVLDSHSAEIVFNDGEHGAIETHHLNF